MNIVYIPNGPANLATIFPTLDFDTVESYRLEILDNTDTVIATTPLNKVEIDCPDNVKLKFINGLGAEDTAIFKIVDIQHETKSDLSQVPLQSPLVKSVHGINRYNIKSNDIYQVEAEFEESEMPWIKELFDTSFLWMEWTGTQGQDDDIIPVVLVDKRVQVRKNQERYSYTITIDFYLSHEKITIRG